MAGLRTSRDHDFAIAFAVCRVTFERQKKLAAVSYLR